MSVHMLVMFFTRHFELVEKSLSDAPTVQASRDGGDSGYERETKEISRLRSG